MRYGTLSVAMLLAGCLGGAIIDFEDGEWSVSNTEYESNDCNLMVPEGDLIIDITKVDADLISIIWEEEVLDCENLGDGFECEAIVTVTDFTDNLDAVATNEAYLSGTFDDSVSGTITLTTSFRCEGNDCADVEVGGDLEGENTASLPCTSISTSDINKK